MDPKVEVLNSAIAIGDRSFLLVHPQDTSLITVSHMNGRFEAKEMWRTQRIRGSLGPLVHHEGLLYGFVGPHLVCVDARSASYRLHPISFVSRREHASSRPT